MYREWTTVKEMRLLTRIFLRYLTGKKCVVILDIDFDAEKKYEIVRSHKNFHAGKKY